MMKSDPSAQHYSKLAITDTPTLQNIQWRKPRYENLTLSTERAGLQYITSFKLTRHAIISLVLILSKRASNTTKWVSVAPQSVSQSISLVHLTGYTQQGGKKSNITEKSIIKIFLLGLSTIRTKLTSPQTKTTPIFHYVFTALILKWATESRRYHRYWVNGKLIWMWRKVHQWLART
jgi:hypothetical protein